jgi:hypothetical protein
MSKAEKRAIIEADKEALEERRKVVPAFFAFPATEDDHCETGADAYADIGPVLRIVAEMLGKRVPSPAAPSDLAVWDPYFCAGAVTRHLAAQGFPRVHNVNEDFYAVLRSGPLPAHDVVLTNPAYSGDHIPRLLEACGGGSAAASSASSSASGSGGGGGGGGTSTGRFDSQTPFLLLMPTYVAGKEYYARALTRFARVRDAVYLFPPKRYAYWTPHGLRDKTQSHASSAGTRTSPFVSMWFCHFGRHHARIVEQLGLRDGKRVAAVQGSRLCVARSLHDIPDAIRPRGPWEQVVAPWQGQGQPQVAVWGQSAVPFAFPQVQKAAAAAQGEQVVDRQVGAKRKAVEEEKETEKEAEASSEAEPPKKKGWTWKKKGKMN